jgi:hypothetical protein
MTTHLQLTLWQQVALVILVPVLVGSFIAWRYVYRAVHPDSTKPLRKRKRKRHHYLHRH